MPKKGYAHIRANKPLPYSVYDEKTPIRSAAKKMLFKSIDSSIKTLRRAKKSKYSLMGDVSGLDDHRASCNLILSNDFGKIPALRNNLNNESPNLNLIHKSSVTDLDNINPVIDYQTSPFLDKVST